MPVTILYDQKKRKKIRDGLLYSSLSSIFLGLIGISIFISLCFFINDSNKIFIIFIDSISLIISSFFIIYLITQFFLPNLSRNRLLKQMDGAKEIEYDGVIISSYKKRTMIKYLDSTLIELRCNDGLRAFYFDNSFLIPFKENEHVCLLIKSNFVYGYKKSNQNEEN